MDRNEFIRLMGSGVALMAMTTCFNACESKSEENINPNNNGPVDFTLDLSLSANAELNRNGGYIYVNDIIVARTQQGTLVAVSKTCTHASCDVTFVGGAQNRFTCPCHGSQFSPQGAVLQGPAISPLKQYQTQLNGNLLRVFE